MDTGLLWLINASVLHPRGFALAIHVEDGVATGWSLMGDGEEPWRFAVEEWPDDVPTVDDRFAAVKELLS
jgi:hypothetical protein